jgi:hypothetical protein
MKLRGSNVKVELKIEKKSFYIDYRLYEIIHFNLIVEIVVEFVLNNFFFSLQKKRVKAFCKGSK